RRDAADRRVPQRGATCPHVAIQPCPAELAGTRVPIDEDYAAARPHEISAGSSRAASWRPEIDITGMRTRVLVEQTGAVEATRLGRRVAHLSPEESWGVDDALRTLLALG